MQVRYRDGRSGLLPGGPAIQTDAEGRFNFSVGSGDYYVRLETRNLGTAKLWGKRCLLPGSYGFIPSENAEGRQRRSPVCNGHQGPDNPRCEDLGNGYQPASGGRTSARGGNTTATRSISSLYLVRRNPAMIDFDVPLLPVRAVGVRSTDPDVTPFEIRGVPPGEYDFIPCSRTIRPEPRLISQAERRSLFETRTSPICR